MQGISANPPQSKLLPKPTNVRVQVINGDHQITWDYDQQMRGKYLNGFNLYRGYYCPGPNAGPPPMSAPLVAGAMDSAITVKSSQIPPGCACTYLVSAFGRTGESEKASLENAQDCKANTPDEKITVTFKDLTISAQTLPNPQNAEGYLWANLDTQGTGSGKVFLTSGTHQFSQLDFGPDPGVQPVTPMTIGIGKTQTLQLGFYFSNICKSDDLILKPPAGGWSSVNQDVTVQSNNGGCKVTVHIGGSANAQQGGQAGGQQGNQPGGQAQPGGQQGNPPSGQAQPGGQKCAGQSKCSIAFVNKGSHPITSLKIAYDPNDPSKVTDVIQKVSQIILPGGSLTVQGFQDTTYAYAFEYGFLQNGQVVTLLPGPASTFSGSAGSVEIQDPGIQQLLSMYQNSAPWSAMDILDNFVCHTFEFRQDGTFSFYKSGKLLDTGTYGAKINRQPGAYGIEFTISGSKYAFPNGTYYYAGPMAGLLYVNTGVNSSIMEFVQKQTCLAP